MALKDRLYDTPVVGTAMRVQDRYKEDAGDQFAGAIGFFGFLSLFPLILLALSVTGFVLADASEARITQVAQAIQDAIPGFSAALGGGEDSTGVGQALQTIIDNRETGGIVGLALLLLSGLRVVNAAQTATLVIFRVDLTELSSVKRKVQQLVALVVLGLLALVGVAAGSAIGVVAQNDFLGVMDVLAPVITVAVTFLLDAGLFLAAYRLFGTRDGPPWRTLVPGAILGGLGWTLLKLFGSTYVSSQVSSANELYGAIGGVIGLMLLLYLAGRLFVYGAELSAVRAPDPDDPTEAPEQVGPESRVAADDTAAAAGAAGAPPSDQGRPRLAARTGPTSSDRPTTAEAARSAPAASERTRSRLAAMPEPPRGGQGRQALGFALAVGAVAGLVGALRPWEQK